MAKIKYLLVDMSVLPDVYAKVIEAKGYLQSGEAANSSQAAKMAGISRSAYYKYKDKIFEYSEQGDDALTINAKLKDNAGVLSSVMNELYLAGANILAVNQSVPVNNIADVSITVRFSDAQQITDDTADKQTGNCRRRKDGKNGQRFGNAELHRAEADGLEYEGEQQVQGRDDGGAGQGSG